jgi:hypothetical protein
MKNKESNRMDVTLSQEHWELLRGCIPTDVTQAAAVKWEGDRVQFQILNRHVVVFPSDERVEIKEGDSLKQASGILSLVAITYLYYTKGGPLSGEWVTEKDLTCASFFRGVHQLPLGHLLQHFANDPKLFIRAAEKLGGSITNDGGDASVLFWVLPKVPVKLILWCKDDEFPAAITALFDRSIEHYLPADGIFVMIALLQEELLQAVPEQK